jgi:hypothetical protein
LILITLELTAWDVFWIILAASLASMVGAFLEGVVKGVLKKKEKE